MLCQVSSFEPDFVLFGKWCELPVGVGLHDLVSKGMGGEGFILGYGKGLELVFHGRKLRVRNDGGSDCV